MPHLRGPRVLEVSFGTGYLLTRYAGRFEAHGVDINRRMLAVAQANLRRAGLQADLRQGDVEALPYPDASFDTVLCTEAFSGYPDGHAALAEMLRVLKPDGRLVLIDVGYPSDGNRLGTWLTRFWMATGDLIRDMDAMGRASARRSISVLLLPVRRRTSPMRITSKGQVTIPQAVREQAGLLPETDVEFVVEPDGVRIVKTRASRRPSRGARAVEHLRRSAGHVSMSTDEIMALTRGDG